MVRREETPDLIKKIAAHPSVAPFVGHYGMDFDAAFPATRSGAVILTNGEDAAMVFELAADRLWQVCTMYQDTCRGKRAIETGLAMRAWMEPHADTIFGTVPDSMPHAKRFYAALGGERVENVESDEHVWTPRDGEEMFAWRVH